MKFQNKISLEKLKSNKLKSKMNKFLKNDWDKKEIHKEFKMLKSMLNL